MFLVTDLARAQQADLEKRRKRQREQGGTPLHAAAEGHQEAVEEQQDAAKALHDVRHPAIGRFTTASAWPGTGAHAENAGGARVLRVGDPQAPAPTQQAVLSDRFSGDHSERYVHLGSAPVQHLALDGAFPLPVSTIPTQPLPHIAPINTGNAR